jgi:hypothetical protein
MDNPRFSLDEFKTLFPNRFESQEKLLSEYQSFLLLLEQLDRLPAPELSDRDKAEIFRRSWQGRPRDWSPVGSWLGLLRRPAVTFAAGIVLGCLLMFAVAKGRAALPQPTAPQQPLAVERIGCTQIYTGKIVEDLYPQIENPKIVVERPQKSSSPQRVLYGTLDEGETYVVWNL